MAKVPGPVKASFDLRSINDSRGTLTVAEGRTDVPFEIHRVYWMTGLGPARGHHAHRTCMQVIVCIAGSFTIHFDDGKEQWKEHLRGPNQAALIEPLVWHWMDGFDEGTICLVLSSCHYDESEYIRDRTTFDQLVGRSR